MDSSKKNVASSRVQLHRIFVFKTFLLTGVGPSTPPASERMGNVCLGYMSARMCNCVQCRTLAPDSVRVFTTGVTDVQHLGGNIGKKNVAHGRNMKRKFDEEPPSPVNMQRDSDSE